jgi:large subunit ribosomal protein L38e
MVLSFLGGEADNRMPIEIGDTEEFVKISERATECRVKRLKDIVRLKLRTARQLYTIKVEPDKAAEILKQIRCEVIEA